MTAPESGTQAGKIATGDVPQHAAARRAIMAVLADADTVALAQAWDAFPEKPAWRWVRPPETGLVMVRGRAGGGGAPFNLGEATVTRCVVALETGETGFSYMLGRDANKAQIAALADALAQTARKGEVEDRIAAPLKLARARAARAAHEETAATKVDFFTIVRGEDE